jgi:methionyl-tRNA formyltransferase
MMKILFLGYEQCKVLDFLRRQGDVLQTAKPIKNETTKRFDLVISFGYRHILSERALANAKRLPINLHISYLPWNKGSAPNFWSFYDDTPKGISIHFMSLGIDEGPILFQREVIFSEDEDDLEKTYNRLIREIQDFFIEKWDLIRDEEYTAFAQSPNVGSYHGVNEVPHLPAGWKTKVDHIRQMR